MPTLAVAKSYLFKLLGREYTQEEFDALCFEFGVELDEVTSEREIFRREHAKQLTDGDAKTRKKAMEEMEKKSADELYKIDTPANRHDLLCAEGMALALRVFKGFCPRPNFKVVAPKLTMTVAPSIRGVRDYVICAVLRNITFTPEAYNSFIDFQERLHAGLARKRTLASVGTHDLDKVKGPFTFECTPKDKIAFSPLNQNGRVLNCAGDGLAKFYEQDKHISKYVPLISELPSYPVIYDANRTIMSLPPIINSDFSRIEQTTKNVFIECTAPDYHKASVLVNQIVCAFSTHCAEPFSVEAVTVNYEDGFALREAHKALVKAAAGTAEFRGDAAPAATFHADPTGAGAATDVTPHLDISYMQESVKRINARVGVSLDAKQCVSYLDRMMLKAEAIDEDTLRVGAPPNRSDILHPCDLIEDVAIAYGYDNIKYVECPTKSTGTQTPMNKMTHLLRLEVANAGYTEMLTFSLCSHDEAFKNLGRKDDNIAVRIENPQTLEFQICRPSLLPGTLKTFAHNKSAPLPLKLFEISDVVVKDPSTRTGARNTRHVAVLHAQSDSSGFEDVHGMAEFVMTKIGILRKDPGQSNAQMAAAGQRSWYYFRASNDDSAFFPGRAMEVVLVTLRDKAEGKASDVSFDEVVVGGLGVLHPDVLRSVDMAVPCSYLEVDIQPMLHLGME